MPKRVLIIQTAFIGDVILATALVEKMHHFFPNAQLDMLVRKGNEGLLEGHPYLHQVWVWQKSHQKYWQLIRLSRQIKKQQYDLVINLQRFAASGLLTALSGASTTLGFRKNPFSFSFSRRFDHRIEAGVHEVDRNLSLITFLTDDSRFLPRLYPSKADYEKVKRKEAYVCIAPTSVWFTKQWPAEKWVGLINRLSAELSVLLLGAPSDREACTAIWQASRHERVENLAGSLSLLQSAALMAGAEMNYVNDSAPLHLASAMNAPVTAFFCSTVPEFGFGPLSDQSIVKQTPLSLKCRPCGLHGKKHCPEGHFKCAEIPANS